MHMNTYVVQQLGFPPTAICESVTTFPTLDGILVCKASQEQGNGVADVRSG
jgi:hypothetical protein